MILIMFMLIYPTQQSFTYRTYPTVPSFNRQEKEHWVIRLCKPIGISDMRNLGNDNLAIYSATLEARAIAILGTSSALSARAHNITLRIRTGSRKIQDEIMLHGIKLKAVVML